MENLIDDVWLMIFKYLNLNDKARLRLVSKKWRQFIDKFAIKKLIIFYNIPPVPGRLKLRNERFGLSDCVYITKWEQFVQNEFVIQHLAKSIEKLVVFSSDKKELCFYELKFDRLFYLELHDVRINERSKFLEENNIETLYLYYRDHLDYFRKDLDDLEKMNKKFGFLKLLSRLKKLRHLNIRNKLTIEFFRNWCDILNKVEILDVHIRDVRTLLFINKEYPNLKVLNAIVFEGLDKFSSYLSPLCMNALKNKLRKDLTVYLYSIPFERENINFICDYLNRSKCQIRLCNSELTFIIEDRFETMINDFSREQDLLDKFYSNINILVINRPYFNELIYRKMINVEYLNLYFNNLYSYNNLPKILEIFNHLKEIKLLFDANQDNGNQIIQLLPIYCLNIFSITIKSSNPTHFDYTPILQLTNLKYIKLTLINPFDHDLLLQIAHLPYLTFFEINFNRPIGFEDSHCKVVQDEISQKLSQIMEKKNLAFYVETQTTLDSDSIYYSMIRKKKTIRTN